MRDACFPIPTLHCTVPDSQGEPPQRKHKLHAPFHRGQSRLVTSAAQTSSLHRQTRRLSSQVGHRAASSTLNDEGQLFGFSCDTRRLHDAWQRHAVSLPLPPPPSPASRSLCPCVSRRRNGSAEGGTEEGWSVRGRTGQRRKNPYIVQYYAV